MVDLAEEVSDAILDLTLLVDQRSDLPREIVVITERLRDLRRRIDEGEMDDTFDFEDDNDD